MGPTYAGLVEGVTRLLQAARAAAVRSVDAVLTSTYWEIGRRIVEFEQGGKRRAGYGQAVLRRLSADLAPRFGRGFSLSNLKQIRRFYLEYTDRGIGQTPSGLLRDEGTRGRSEFRLSWSHYGALLAVSDPRERTFYEAEALLAGWSVRELGRQIASKAFERSAASRRSLGGESDPRSSTPPLLPEETIKDPYILEFLGVEEPSTEKELEEALVDHLAEFLLELGCGFAFVARQKRLQVGDESYFVDLLFYHRGLRCLVAIDLKLGRFTPAVAGQMNLYLNCLREQETLGDEAPPIGIILCSEKNDTMARYALGGIANRIFASRYRLALPDADVLTREVEAERKRLESRTPAGRPPPLPGNP